ncbi:thiamine diphosphokinase [Brevibacillus ruminantium]|uniref:Thiamine diphosphokinase n=1 Tax=Brevibacillus ruminantium TaxID=2950604 RepID=A0ABY4WI29_9BACL|nr:thiamine diphosphokinase [Brevibacillus ruminantium]USG65500.1 thiamine diphosphokinase [Brevibacillus ruminantium]
MTTKSKIILFAGGSLGSWALEEIEKEDVLVGVDRGALFLIQNGRQPHLAIGDFDSVTAAEREVIRQNSGEMRSCDPVMKDLTDTEMGLRWALDQQPAEIVLAGALGSRFDHSLANVHLLRKALVAGVPCRIVDEKNQVLLVDQQVTLHRKRFAHVSLLPLTEQVSGITLTGFQYPLDKATLRIGDTLGISNVLLADTGTVTVADGYLLVIQSMD